ncbi:type II toxin-antitoxin system RelE/ParE family toxin [Novosphingobium sp. KA1]|uniref:type II toxin-antitoxin system RelE/ParE family toxin n=1 Tax=Novosphingobium sp. (strain KA1) TaxID=164608 RepID=UPI001A8DD3E3|nr:hypothetical protein CA833_02555 [Novosphingobium sp. KA1]
MKIGFADKRLKELSRTGPGEPSKYFQPKVALTIHMRLTVLSAANDLAQVASANPSWRVHAWNGRKNYWSIDITGNTRLLFDYDKKAKEIANMIYDDPH